MREVVDFLVSARVMDLAADPRVLIACGIVFLIAVALRWKYVLLFMFGTGALLAVTRFSRLSEGHAAVDSNMLVFAVGTLLVGVVLIYFLFIKGD